VNPSKQSAMVDSSAFLAATLPDLLQRVSRGRSQAEVNWWNRQRLAPDFRSFSFFNTRETVLSGIFAALLDPEGTHGQRTLFLDSFLELLGLRDLIGRRVRFIKPEQAFHLPSGGTAGNIDILIYFDNFIIGIENKARGASEQKNQVKRYVEELTRRGGENFHLLYLSFDSEKPRSIDASQLACLERNGKFSQSPFDTFVRDWIQPFIETPSLPQRLSDFLTEFVTYSHTVEKETFMTSHELRSELIEYSLESPATVSATFALIENGEAITKAVCARFLNTLWKRLTAAEVPPGWKPERYAFVEIPTRNPPCKDDLLGAAFPDEWRMEEWRWVCLQKQRTHSFSVGFEIGQDRNGNFLAGVGLRKAGDFHKYQLAQGKPYWARQSEIRDERRAGIQAKLSEMADRSDLAGLSDSGIPPDWEWYRSVHVLPEEWAFEITGRPDSTDAHVRGAIEGLSALLLELARALDAL
jgi:PD-(D/E)XK nuclease superfamily